MTRSDPTVAVTSALSVRTYGTSYSLAVDGITWIDSGPTRLHGAALTALHGGRKAAGHDSLGHFVDFQLDYSCAPLETGVCFSTIIRDYTPSGLPLVSFHQRHVKERNATAVGSNVTLAKDAVLSAFPSFKVSALPASVGTPHELGAMIYYDQMLGGMVNGTRFIKWNSTNEVVGGSMGGPTVLFDAAQTRAMVLSPWREFMAGSSVQRFNGTTSLLDFGLLGSINVWKLEGNQSNIVAITSGRHSSLLAKINKAIQAPSKTLVVSGEELRPNALPS